MTDTTLLDHKLTEKEAYRMRGQGNKQRPGFHYDFLTYGHRPLEPKPLSRYAIRKNTTRLRKVAS